MEQPQRGQLSRLIRPAIDLLIDAMKAYQGHRVLALGASRVGKTTLWRYLEQGGAAAATDVERTLEPYAVGDGRFKVRDIRVAGVRVRLRAVDVPGQVELRRHWGEVFEALRPRAVIFMIDHAALENDPLDDRGVNTERMREHANAFADFRTIVEANSDLKGSLKALAIMANKSDIWPKSLVYGRLLQYTGVGEQLRQMKDGLSTLTRETSARYGQGVRPAVEWLARSL